MIKRTFLLTVAGAVALAFAGVTAAQTCTNPLPIHSDSSVTGDTCTASNSVPNMGPGYNNPQNDIVYSFVADGANATITYTSPNADGVAYLLTGCNDGSNPIDFAFNGHTMTLTSSTAPDGATRYFNSTSDGTTPDDTCGEFTITVDGRLPVELQSFSVM